MAVLLTNVWRLYVKPNAYGMLVIRSKHVRRKSPAVRAINAVIAAANPPKNAHDHCKSSRDVIVYDVEKHQYVKRKVCTWGSFVTALREETLKALQEADKNGTIKINSWKSQVR